MFRFLQRPVAFSFRFPISSVEAGKRQPQRRSYTLFRVLLFSLISSATLLVAAPQPQPFHRPLVFEPNRGQAPLQATWTAHGPGYQFQLTNDAVVMMFRERASGAPRTLQIRLTGSRSWNHVVGLDPTGGVSNYLNRPNGADSLSSIPHGRLRVAEVYPGIDFVLYSDGGNLEYDFLLQPGADPKQIQVAFDGQNDLRLDRQSGDLVLTMPAGSELRQIRPKVYQQVGDRRVEVAGGYQLLSGGRAAFTLAAYDPKRPLIIDPTVRFFLLAWQHQGNHFFPSPLHGRDLPITLVGVSDYSSGCNLEGSYFQSPMC
jgi:hypothetical protein